MNREPNTVKPNKWQEFKQSLVADEEHNKNVRVLQEYGIIGQPDAWYNLDKIHVNNVKALIQKTAMHLKK